MEQTSDEQARKDLQQSIQADQQELENLQKQQRSEGNLAERMIVTLKQRIDPQGLMNLEWRPLSTNRFEVRMPAGSEECASGPQHLPPGPQYPGREERLPQRDTPRAPAPTAQRQQNIQALTDREPAEKLTELAGVYDRLQQVRSQVSHVQAEYDQLPVTAEPTSQQQRASEATG